MRSNQRRGSTQRWLRRPCLLGRSYVHGSYGTAPGWSPLRKADGTQVKRGTVFMVGWFCPIGLHHAVMLPWSLRSTGRAHKPCAREGGLIIGRLGLIDLREADISPRSLHCMTRRIKTMRKKKPGHSGRDDRQKKTTRRERRDDGTTGARLLANARAASASKGRGASRDCARASFKLGA